MKNDLLEGLLKNAKPVIEPQIKTEIKRTCNNCMDSIVCYGMDEPQEPNKAESCPDWQLDFMEYQDYIETEE